MVDESGSFELIDRMMASLLHLSLSPQNMISSNSSLSALSKKLSCAPQTHEP